MGCGCFCFGLAWNPTQKKNKTHYTFWVWKKTTALVLRGLEATDLFCTWMNLFAKQLCCNIFCVCRSINHFRNECSLQFCLLLSLQVFGSSCDVYTLLLEEGWRQACQSWWEVEVLIVKDLVVDWQHTWQMMSFVELVCFFPFFSLLLSLSPLFLPCKTLSSVCLCVGLGPFKTQTFSASWMSLVIVCIL